MTATVSKSEQVLLERYTDAHLKKIESLHKKLAGVISPLLRWTVFSVNVIFWVVGLCLILLGIWAFIQKTQKLKSRTVKSIIDFVTDIAIVVAVLGVIIFVLAFAGCVGVLRQNIPLLKFFKTVLILILGLQLIMLVVVVVFSAVSVGYIRDFIKLTAIAAYREDVDLQNFVDWIQLTLECCGVGAESYLDWNGNRYFNCTPSNPSPERCSVPFSCCLSPNDIDEEIINTRCAYKVMEKDPVEINAIVWPYGCIDKMIGIVQQQAIYSVIGLTVYMVSYCLVIDVIERLIAQIDQFREDWFRLYNKQNSIEAVSLSDLVHIEYKKKVAEAKKDNGSPKNNKKPVKDKVKNDEGKV